MSKRTKKEIWLLILYCITVIGSGFGLFGGVVGLFWIGKGFIALIIVSVIAFIGAIYGIVHELYVKRTQREKKTKRIVRSIGEIIIWGVVAIGSVAGVVLIGIKGMEWLDYNWGLWIMLICLFAALFFFSIFMLVFRGRRRKETIADAEHPSDVEEEIDE
ncbi:MAG: hypothetical protein H7641_00960 [Candidatus Heimdallarchaeota archaeon]|nr:hypothetical protein [Candidatus Heimdallarchaeota archaeon]MCK4876136.1 hypothetical protein [Candidatus Heimdallarchaeota archaeon]